MRIKSSWSLGAVQASEKRRETARAYHEAFRSAGTIRGWSQAQRRTLNGHFPSNFHPVAASHPCPSLFPPLHSPLLYHTTSIHRQRDRSTCPSISMLILDLDAVQMAGGSRSIFRRLFHHTPGIPPTITSPPHRALPSSTNHQLSIPGTNADAANTSCHYCILFPIACLHDVLMH
jgi:hypothetical protein